MPFCNKANRANLLRFRVAEPSIDEEAAIMATAPTPSSDVFGSSMTNGLRELFPFPADAATAYLANRDELANLVDRALLHHDDLSSLIGYCPVDVMMTNHKNHACFMGTVFSLNAPDLLMRVMPWVYRAYTRRGFSFDYFPAALAAWIAAAQERLAPAHAAAVAGVYRWMLAAHQETIRLSGGPSPFMPDHWSESAEELLRCALAGNSRETQRFVAEQVKTREALAPFYLGMVQPTMYRVGTLWEEGAVSVSQEHAATAIMARAMAFAYQRFDLSGDAKGKALLACACNEHHELGGRIVADLLEMDGWDVSFLGANVPKADFLDMAQSLTPDMIGLSATMPYNLLEAREMVGMIRSEPSLKDAPVLLGGMVLRLVPDAYKAIGADMQAEDAKEAVALASQLWAERGGRCP